MKKLDLKFKFTKIDQGCLLASLEIAFNFLDKKVNIGKMRQELSQNKFGYDILEVASYLIEKKFEIEVGCFDSDIFKEKKVFTLEELKDIYQNEELSKYPKEDLAELIKFAKKYPDKLNVGYKDLDFLKQLADKDLPTITNLEIKTYTGDKTDNSIHSVVIGGYDKDDIFIMDPILEKIRLSSKTFKKAWFNAGQYYLVVKNKTVISTIA